MCMPVHASSFALHLCDARLLANDNRSRSFVTVLAAPNGGAEQVCRAIRAVDQALALFGLPSYYQASRPQGGGRLADVASQRSQ